MTQPPQYPAHPPYNHQTPPAAPGYPQAQPDSPTYPPNQTFPGQPPQPGSTYPQTQPTNQPYPQQPATPPPPPKNNTTTGIIITMGALLIVLVIAVVYLAITKNNPTANPTPSATPSVNTTPSTTFTPTPTPGRGWTINGNQLTGPTMTAQLPPGWRLSEENGVDNDGEIIDGRSRIKYWANLPRTSEESCNNAVSELRRSPNDALEQIPGQQWTGKPVLTYQLTTTLSKNVVYTLYCIDTGKETSAVLQTGAWAEYKEQVHSAGQVIMTTWQWK